MVRVVDARRLEAMSAGATEVLVRSGVGRAATVDRRRAGGESTDARHASLGSQSYCINRIAGEELLFVGHANLDGFDHTAVAKPGIDRLVRAFKVRGHPVVYFVSKEYPYWYTADRQPDLAIASEGQEHRTLVDAERIVFTGGEFMLCLLRNAQVTLHGMLKAGDRDRIHFAFPAYAIWTADSFTPGRLRPYPAPMVLLDRLLAARPSEQDRHERLVVAFLDRLFGEFPVLGYPAIAPEPPLEELVNGWTVEVSFNDALVRRYRQGDTDKIIRFDFLSTSMR